MVYADVMQTEQLWSIVPTGASCQDAEAANRQAIMRESES